MKGIAGLTATIAALGIVISLFGQAAVAQPVDFDLDYSDPASDVMWVLGNGTMYMQSEPKDVNIKWLRSALEPGGETIRLTIELSNPGQIRTDNASIYQINIYTTAGNESHFVVKYNNGGCTMGTNTSTDLVNGSVQYSISDGALDCFVNRSDLGNITFYNVDASAETREYENATVGYVLKKDFGWEVPGNPGTVPGDPPDGEGTPGFGLWMIATATVIAVGATAIMRRRGR